MSLIGSVTLPNLLTSSVGGTAAKQAEDAAKTRRAFEVAQSEAEKTTPAKSAGQQGYGTKTADTLFNAQSIAQQFKDYMDKSPEELMRQQILKELGYSEEDLAAMTPDERAKAEAEILERIKMKIEQSMREKGLDVEIGNAEIASSTSI